jgi:hypothetical protein
MWSPDVIKSEELQEKEFVRLYTKYTAEVRSKLQECGVSTEVALQVAAGKQVISRAALDTTSGVDVPGLLDKIQHCVDMRVARIEKRVACFERGWLEKCVKRMHDRLRIGKENGNYQGSGATMS